MKIYRDDGTYCHSHSSDTDFGWTLEDIPVAETVPPDQKAKKTKMEGLPNPIDVQEAESAQAFDLSIEKDSIAEDVDKKTPRSRILDLINPCTIESKMLLSVVHYAMYKNFNPEMIKVEPLQDGAQIHYLENTEDIILDGIITYHQNNDHSLLVELILTHNKCDVHEITKDSVDIGEERSKAEEDPEKHSPKEPDQIECDLLYERIRNLSLETKLLRSEIPEIRYDFQQQATRAEYLIRQAKKSEKDLRETKFLEDLVRLLKGELQHVVLKESPFRIFSKSATEGDKNLII